MERRGVEEIPASLLHRAHRPIYAWSWKDDPPFQMDLFPHVQTFRIRLRCAQNSQPQLRVLCEVVLGGHRGRPFVANQ